MTAALFCLFTLLLEACELGGDISESVQSSLPLPKALLPPCPSGYLIGGLWSASRPVADELLMLFRLWVLSLFLSRHSQNNRLCSTPSCDATKANPICASAVRPEHPEPSCQAAGWVINPDLEWYRIGHGPNWKLKVNIKTKHGLSRFTDPARVCAVFFLLDFSYFTLQWMSQVGVPNDITSAKMATRISGVFLAENASSAFNPVSGTNRKRNRQGKEEYIYMVSQCTI